MEEEAAEVGAVVQQQHLGGTLTVSKQEWDQIDQLSAQTRAVGKLFQTAAERLRKGEASESRKCTFDEKVYGCLCDALPPQNKGSKRSKAEEIKQKCLEASLKQDKARALAGASATSPPRRDCFGSRTESYVFSVLHWLRAQELVSRAVAARKFSSWLRGTVGSLPAVVEKELLDMARGDDNPLAALDFLCSHEEVLACDVCADELRLREEQEAVVRAVRQACLSRRSLLLKYKTPPSGGKSSASALLGAALSDVKDCYLLYTCYSRLVRIDVCKHLVAACVPFAILVQGIASPSFSCFFGKPKKPQHPPPPDMKSRVAYSLKVCRTCERPPQVLVCDLVSTALLLQSRSEDVLLFDEPTADVAPHMRQQVRAVLRLCPKVTVLMSATVPEFEQMTSFVKSFQDRHPTATTLSVSGHRLATSVTALTAEGAVLAPHNFDTTLADVRSSGHLQRFYAPQVLRALRPAPEELSFFDLTSYEAVREACLKILEARGCRLPPPPPVAHVALELVFCCTKHAQLLPGSTLIVADSPKGVEDSVENNLVGVPSLRRLLKAGEVSKKLKKDEKQLEEDAKGGWDEEGGPVMALRYTVNSNAHLRRFRGSLEGFPEKLLRSPMLVPDDVVSASNEQVVEAALCGVLFFDNEMGDAAFEAAAQTLAEKACESFVVGGKSLVYGLNLPFDRLVVACTGLTRSELQQLCGRVGRTCRSSSKAEIVFLDLETARKALTLGNGREDDDGPRLFDVSSSLLK